MKQSSLAYVFMKPMFQALTELRNTTDNWTLARDFCSIEVFALASDEELMGLILGGGKVISSHTNKPHLPYKRGLVQNRNLTYTKSLSSSFYDAAAPNPGYVHRLKTALIQFEVSAGS